ncbi:hypothetical protein CAEBREN_07551 [Caenorhabditis brenneri]|uniref:Uncharacterized protein n=1 Tax=Caenorhabditis brenneri TaxID=135651 RepID=G0N4W7_CAEBE|nr:hypothetical protein CAEBREN_07551 [Caenorhabditis brenneri]
MISSLYRLLFSNKYVPLAEEDPCLRRNSLNADGYYRDLEKMHERGLFTTGVNYNAEKSEDFLSLIERMQSNRLDDQRCEMPERFTLPSPNQP